MTVQYDNQHVDDLLPAYVLGALEAHEVEAVEAHLPGCERCAAALDDLIAVMDGLALAPDLLPPDSDLRARIQAQVEAEPRGPVGERPATVPENPRTTGILGRLIDLFRRTASPASDVAAELRSILATPGSEIWDLTGTDAAPAARARLVTAPERRGAVLVTEGLPRLASGQVYQVWFIAEGADPTPNVTFQVDRRGRAEVTARLTHDIRHYAVAAVTPEPMGGSPGPTGAIVLAGTLARDETGAS